MNNIKKLIFKTQTEEEIPPSLLGISAGNWVEDGSSRTTVSVGTGEPGEIIGLSFQITVDGGFTSIDFLPSSVSLNVTPGNPYREGSVTLDGAGLATFTLALTPPDNMTKLLITIISRSSGLPDGIGESAIVEQV